ncbi:MFS general substrate transporter [Neoconidiobolus thromboides FSU 785]|nr:MFS general substrate transporter [Neoconidiobolus thromboides FSU 785]
MEMMDIKEPSVFEEPLNRREEWGFYMFNFANEPFLLTVAGLASTVILEGLASGAAYELDLITPCNTKITDYVCKVKFGVIWLDTSSYTFLISALAVAIQAVVFISIGAMADYGNLRKLMLFASSFVQAIAIILISSITSYDYYWVAAILIIIGNIGFGASNIFYYAYLPILTSSHPDVIQAKEDSNTNLSLIREKVSNTISGKGMAIGYLGGFIHLIISALFVLFAGAFGPVGSYPMQVVAALSGVWTIIFNIIPFLWLKNRSGNPLPKGENYLLHSWKQVGKTFRQIKNLSHLAIVLFSWFIMSDSLHTFLSMTVLLAKKEFKFLQYELLIANLVTPVTAFLGCLIFNQIIFRFKVSTKAMLIICCICYLVIPIYVLLGLIPNLPFSKFKIEGYILMGYHGFFVGPIQSFYRVLFAELVPKGRESEFFSLFQIVGKGSSWIGPLVVGAITDYSGNLRIGYTFILASVLSSGLILMFLNVEKGKEQVKILVKKD